MSGTLFQRNIESAFQILKPIKLVISNTLINNKMLFKGKSIEEYYLENTRTTERVSQTYNNLMLSFKFTWHYDIK